MSIVSQDNSKFLIWFGLLCGLLFIVIQRTSSASTGTKHTADFKAFQKSFLVVYYLAMMADWMQGPYVYALYKEYGFSIQEIGQLFIAGFGSSLLFGTIVGGAADKLGRRFNCIMFAVLYSLSCVTKHFNDYGILMIGRLLGGISTSILYSAFESWMNAEHKRHAFPDEWLPSTYSLMIFGSGLLAIVAGIIASALASTSMGMVAPFDGSMVLLILCGSIVALRWTENYGDNRADTSASTSFVNAWKVLTSNERVFLLGLIQSCFEAAMYIFVFMWTPTIEGVGPEKREIPHGVIFAMFMVCVMIGSKMFPTLLETYTVESLARAVFATATVALSMPIFFTSLELNLLAFCCFELTVGAYFPAAATMRSAVIPEEVRSTLMNFFRVGLNAIVVLVLLNIQAIPVFHVCVSLLSIATLAQHRLFALSLSNQPKAVRAAAGLEVGEEMDDMLSAKEDAQA